MRSNDQYHLSSDTRSAKLASRLAGLKVVTFSLEQMLECIRSIIVQPARPTTRTSNISTLLVVFLAAALSGNAQLTSTETLWSTYLGGLQNDQVLSIAHDAFGHVYIAGRTSAGIRLGNDSSGQSGLVHQDTISGGVTDAFLAKIAPHGSMLWLTYFGGEDVDEAVQVVITGMNGVYLVGNTLSTMGIASDTLSFQDSIGGNGDVFVARFTEYGLLLGATYLGGSGTETASSATLDERGRLVVAAYTDGAGAIPGGVPVAHAYNGGTDGVLYLLNGTDSLIAGSFIGHNGEDRISSVVTGDSTGVVIAGTTNSAQGMATAGAQDTTLNGTSDGFVMKLDTALSIVHGAYLGGNASDTITALSQHEYHYAVCGVSWSDSLYHDTLAHQVSNHGAGDGFIIRMDSALAIDHSSFFGGPMYDALHGIAFDEDGALYACGTTSSIDSISNASGQGAMLNGIADGFALRSDTGLTLTWSRYFGAMDAEDANAISIMGHTSVLLGGRTGSASDLSLLGHQMIYGGGNWDGYTARLDQLISTTAGGICTGTSSGSGNSGSTNGVSEPLDQIDVCLGDSILLVVYGGALGIDAEWMWYMNGCGIPNNFLTSGDTIVLWPTQSFILSVRAESQNDATACSYIDVVVHTFPQPVVNITDTVCPGGLIDLQGSGANAFQWNILDTLLSGSVATIAAPLQGDTLLQVGITATNGPACSVDLQHHTLVLPHAAPQWSVTDVSCHGDPTGSILLQQTNTPIVDLSWWPGGFSGDTLTDLSAGLYIATLTDTNTCTFFDTITVIEPEPLLDSVATTATNCGLAQGTAQVFSSSTGQFFDWGNGYGTSSLVSDLLPGTYIVHAIDSIGCTDSLAYLIEPFGEVQVQILEDTLTPVNLPVWLQAFIQTTDSISSMAWWPTAGLTDSTSSDTWCTPTHNTWYFFTASTISGCTSTDSVMVIPPILPIITDSCGEAFLPNIFSPNNDGLNDELCLMGECYASVKFTVYDRWGQMVYRNTEVGRCWNGVFNGSPLPSGAYPFTLLAIRTNGQQIELTGFIRIQL